MLGISLWKCVRVGEFGSQGFVRRIRFVGSGLLLEIWEWIQRVFFICCFLFFLGFRRKVFYQRVFRNIYRYVVFFEIKEVVAVLFSVRKGDEKGVLFELVICVVILLVVQFSGGWGYVQRFFFSQFGFGIWYFERRSCVRVVREFVEVQSSDLVVQGFVVLRWALLLFAAKITVGVSRVLCFCDFLLYVYFFCGCRFDVLSRQSECFGGGKVILFFVLKF